MFPISRPTVKKCADCNLFARKGKINPGFYIRSLHNLSVLIFGYCWSSRSFIYFPVWLHPYKPN